MALPFRRKNKAAPPPEAKPKGEGGSAAILAARFGVGKSRAGAAPDDDDLTLTDDDGLPAQDVLATRLRRPGRGPDPFPSGSGGKKGKGRVRLSAPVLTASLLVLAGAGTLVWLSLSTHDTAARLEASRLPGDPVPVLLPDGSPRFPDPVAAAGPDQAEPASPADGQTAQAAAPEAPLDPVDMPVTLSPSRNDLLLERLRVGRVPKVAPDGLTSWQYYARAFPQDDKRPRIALVVTGMGQSVTATQEAIARLPGAVSFVFTPTSADPQPLVDEAREKGHEVLLAVPMQPVGYPANDPGANTLLLSQSDEENVRRLETVMASFTGYVGIAPRTDTGSAFLTQRDNLRAVLQQVQRRGLLFLDLWQGQGSRTAEVARELTLPRALGDLQLDRVPSAAGIDAQLAQLEKLAQANGVAVGYVEAQNPVSLDRIAFWAAGLRDRGIVLAPVTAVVNRQADR
ncbi:divergent polysaccharide deacetylase family protein [Niveispirillum irakense]|uniref:divergent polysaccharide deacetylase family protein n=1 Tax=Niveispirillum irakense TaxID=34011 RepID=UPI00041AD074|nr:divergent polysaccharide deacetylase family protein [Niveispirillum irakense]